MDGTVIMKVLIDARSIGVKPTGVGMYGYNFIQALVEYDDVELHVLTDVIESDQMKQMQENKRITVHFLAKKVSRSFGVFRYFQFVKNKITEIKPDIFWEINNMIPIPMHNPYGRYAVTIHDAFPITMPECFIPLYKYYFWLGVNVTLRCCDLVIYNSNETKKQIEDIFKKAKDKDSFISKIIIPPVAKVITESKNSFLYLGTLERRKGTDILIKAFDKYVELGGTRDLILAGDVREEDMRLQMQTAMERNNGEQKPMLKYWGYANDSDKSELYCGCDCFVFPSRAEGFGMPIVEALGCDMDVIASNLPIFEEVAGKAIETFALSNDADKSAESLANAMKRYDDLTDKNRKDGEKQEIVRRYQKENLGKEMYDSFKNTMVVDKL